MNDTKVRPLQLPLTAASVKDLRAGDNVALSGLLLTARDEAHKWIFNTFITQKNKPTNDDLIVYSAIQPILHNGAIYHCGPVVDQDNDGSYRFVAAGPTSSIREEPYQSAFIRHFGLKAIMGKGGMGANTLNACQEAPAVYLHATGGAAALAASCIREVLGVYKLEFGTPEAMWLIRVEDFPLVVSMDAHGISLHDRIRVQSAKIYNDLIS